MKKDNENKIDQDEEGTQEGESGSTGQGGVAGEVRFRYHESLASKPRDDALPPTEIKRLLAIHHDLHKEYVNKQKLTRKERKALKEGIIKLATTANRLGHGQGKGRASSYKQHPITNKAQFSGMDRQVIGLPNENMSKTNDDKRKDLENRLENRHENRNELRYQNAPKFNPTPRPR